MDDDRVVAVDVKDADLQEGSVGGWSNEHRQILFQDDAAHSCADGVPDVRVDNTVFPRWLTNPHLDKIACLSAAVKENWSASNIAHAVLNELAGQAGRARSGRRRSERTDIRWWRDWSPGRDLRRHEPSRNAGMSSRRQGQPRAEIQGAVINRIIAAEADVPVAPDAAKLRLDWVIAVASILETYF